ncbi:MAG TPA: hypothetical protein VH988_05685 [Thermoanaerobaculia bacterium]|nr:hypothetical protein [Thermoanaerobaculia bacterium]
MIKINRGHQPPGLKVYTSKSVKALDGVTKVTKAEQELERAIAFFMDPNRFSNEKKLTRDTFTFAVYKDPEIQEKLAAVFGTKCAYCETDFGPVTPKDIEHFRPKSEITAGRTTLIPGYFWLAGEWDNLLVSCPDCNRGRKHEVPGQPEKTTLGKETQFPLSDEQHRARNRAPLVNEETVRLLLNPCGNDEPEKHLMFDDQGLIHPRPDANNVPSGAGTMSIAVYALRRKPLVENRLKELNRFRLLFENLNHLVKNHNDLRSLGASQAMLDNNGAQIARVKSAMVEMLGPKGQYLAMLRDWIRRAKANGECALLEQFGIDLTTLIP